MNGTAPSETSPRFETTLPREHFFAPKTNPLTRSAKQNDWRGVGITAIIATAVVTPIGILRQEPASRLEPLSRPVPVSLPVPTPAPIPTPIPVSTPAPVVPPSPEPLVLRAQPVEPVVRRGLPVEGNLYAVSMPDGRNLLVRFMGSVRSFDELPKHPNLYDLYQVASSGHSWVFMMSPTLGRTAWIDP